MTLLETSDQALDLAKQLIKEGVVSDGILNKIEMTFRAYDPCHACATHSLPGQMPLIVTVYNNIGEVFEVFHR